MLRLKALLPLIHILHWLRQVLAVLPLALLCRPALALPLQKRLAVLVKLQLRDDHFGGVDAHVHSGTWTPNAQSITHMVHYWMHASAVSELKPWRVPIIIVRVW